MTDDRDRAPRQPRRRRRAGAPGRRPAVGAWSSSSRRPRRRRSPSFLGAGYTVESSIGHIRDLPRNAADVPASHKGEAWARLGVDVDHDFKTLYVVSADKKQQVAKLKALLKDADELFLATDEDREGEAIAWHLLETLKPKVPVRRMVFHEITPQAIQHAVDTPRELDTALVDAQETRRVLDRLYGYEVSPVLWKKVMPKLSAGRVQSVATRIVVERERARMRFVQAGYWDLDGVFTAPQQSDPTAPSTMSATLQSLDGKRLATGASFEQETGAAQGRHRRRAARRGERPRPAGPPRERGLRGPQRRQPALHPQALRAVHDQHPAAGGRPQAALLRAAHDADRPAAVRERPHHLHAHRLGQPVGDGDHRGPAAGPRPLRPGVRPGRAAPLHRQGQERAGGARGDPPVRRRVPHARRAGRARSPATSCGSTS